MTSHGCLFSAKIQFNGCLSLLLCSLSANLHDEKKKRLKYEVATDVPKICNWIDFQPDVATLCKCCSAHRHILAHSTNEFSNDDDDTNTLLKFNYQHMFWVNFIFTSFMCVCIGTAQQRSHKRVLNNLSQMKNILYATCCCVTKMLWIDEIKVFHEHNEHTSHCRIVCAANARLLSPSPSLSSCLFSFIFNVQHNMWCLIYLYIVLPLSAMRTQINIVFWCLENLCAPRSSHGCAQIMCVHLCGCLHGCKKLYSIASILLTLFLHLCVVTLSFFSLFFPHPEF